MIRPGYRLRADLLNTASPSAMTQPQIAIRTMEITAAEGRSVPVSEILL